MKSLFYRIRYGEPVILVSGLPRSGTSMLMQMLEKGGVPIVTDKQRTPDEDNPHGYHELEQVKDLDKTVDKSWLKEHRGKVVKIISFLLNDLPMNLNYKVIFMRRNLDEVLRSQNKMLERNGEKGTDATDEKMRKNYDMHLRKTYYRLNRTPNFQVLYLDYPDVVADPLSAAKKICEFLGGDLSAEQMTDAVDRSLYRNRQAKTANA